MNSSAASHRTLLLLALVALASRGLSFSRGNLSDIGVICFVAVLAGLGVLLLYRGQWQGNSDSRGGFPTWQVGLPCAFVYMFAISAGRHLLVFAPGDWRSVLSTVTWIALAVAAPALLLALTRMRQRLTPGAQMALVLVPLVPVLLLFAMVPAASPRPAIDVFVFETQAARSLLFGMNPYEITFANLYDSAEFYPSGDPDSYPYPPLSLLFAVIGYVLGDVRWPLIACHLAAAGLLFLSARQRAVPTVEAIIFGALFLYLPHAPFVSEQAWTDPTVALGLGLVSLLLARRQLSAALWAAGCTIALKQTMIVLPPLLWGLWRRLSRAQFVALFAVSAVTYGVFLLWNAPQLWNDLVVFHAGTPFRPGALTLSAYLVYFFKTGPLPPWLSLVGLAAGIGAALYALRSGDGASPDTGARVCLFFVGLSFALLLTLALSKHAFMNYFYLVQFCLIAALTWSRIADLEAAEAS